MVATTPFQRVLAELNPDGCLCACHTGTGAATSCVHCPPPAQVPYPITLILDGLPPTALSHNARARRGSRMARSHTGGLFNVEAAQTVAHWRDYARTEALKASRGLPRGSLPAKRLTWAVRFEMPSFSQFARDELNALERMAPIIDGLVDAKLVRNDTWAQVRMLEPPVRVHGEAERTILRVWLWGAP